VLQGDAGGTDERSAGAECGRDDARTAGELDPATGVELALGDGVVWLPARVGSSSWWGCAEVTQLVV